MPASTSDTGQQFEHEVAEVLSLMGFEIQRNRWRAGRQTDVVASRYTYPELQEYLVECKGWKRRIPVNVVSDMHARVEAVRRTESPDIRGWIIARKGFAMNAMEHAQALGILCSTIENLFSELVNFRPYIKRFTDDYENLSERYLDSSGAIIGEPIVDIMLRCDLYKYYVPLDVLVTTEESTDQSDRKNVTTKRRAAIEYVREWLADERSNHLTILGDFGSGKSSFGLHLTYEIAKDYANYLKGQAPRSRIPLFVPLRDYHRRLDIESLLTHLLINRYHIEGNWHIFKRSLESGRILLILDGFDEMVTRSSPLDTIENLREVCKLALPQTKTILTCRTHYFRNQIEVDQTLGRHTANPLMQQIRAQPYFRIVDVAPLTDEQIQQLLSKRLSDDEARHVFEEIQKTYNLMDLSKSPVLCDMIVKTLPVLMKKGEVVSSAQLYDAYTSHWIDTDDWRSIMTPKGKRMLMEELAITMFFERVDVEAQSLHYTELPKPRAEYFKQMLRHDPKAYDLYDHDTRTCTFLNRDADGNYKFIHKSFQEFFVACRLRDQISKGDTELLLKFDAEHRNKEVMFFLRGLDVEQEAISHVLEKTVISVGKGQGAAFEVFLPLLLEALTPRGHVAWACMCYRISRSIAQHRKTAKTEVRRAHDTPKSIAGVEMWVKGADYGKTELMHLVGESLRENDEVAYIVTSCARRAVAAVYPAKATNELAVQAAQEAASMVGALERPRREYWEKILRAYRTLLNRCGTYSSGPGSAIDVLDDETTATKRS